jgi:hypothetical protein
MLLGDKKKNRRIRKKNMALIPFLKTMRHEPMLATIQEEAQVPHGKSGQRGKSPTLLQHIHEFDQEGKHKLSCNRSARGCLVALLEAYLTKSNHKRAAVLAEPLLRALSDFNVSMMSQLFTQVNNAYSRRFGPESPEHLAAKAMFLLHQDERVAKETQAAAVRVENNRNPIEVNELEVYAAIERSTSSTEGTWVDRLIGLGLASGARLIELCGLSTYSESKNVPNLLRVNGVAKDERAAKSRGHLRTLEKPLLMISVERFLEVLAKTREEITYFLQVKQIDLKNSMETSNGRKQVTMVVSPLLNSRLRQSFPFGDTVTFHTLRAIYGNLSWHVFGRHMSLNAWLTDVLGHNPTSLTTSLSYTKITLKRPTVTSAEVKDVRDEIAMLEGKVTALTQQTLRAPDPGAMITVEPPKKKRKLPDFIEEKVTLSNRMGRPVVFNRQTRKSDGNQRERLQQWIQQLRANEVQVSHRHLMRLGFGGGTIHKNRDLLKPVV